MKVVDKIDCTGCGACAAFCCHLKMTMDDEGFRYPQIDHAGCSDCGQCRQICPMIDDLLNTVRHHPGSVDLYMAVQSGYPLVFAAWNNDVAVRNESSSGGVFSLLAQQVIADGGIVVGAGFNGDLLLSHYAVDTIEGLQGLRGSKYIQSDMGNAFNSIKAALINGRQVLFSGTPCQVAGLKSFFGGSHESLITCDLVCHGVPSEKLFRKYIKELEVQHDDHVTAVSFRNKKHGWKRFSMKIDFANGSTYDKPLDHDNFMHIFLSDLCLRPSCYNCPFATIPRQGDISLADYWGIASAHPGIDDDRGVSLVLVNTEKGDKVFQEIAETMIVHPSDLTKAVACNPCIIRPVHQNPERQIFMQHFDRYTIDQLRKKYVRYPSRIREYYLLARKMLSYLKLII